MTMVANSMDHYEKSINQGAAYTGTASCWSVGVEHMLEICLQKKVFQEGTQFILHKICITVTC